MNNQQKQQVLEQIKSANNVLVAVTANPTVDELAASIGLTLALNKMDKHATTVFSGVVPSTIEFLQPDKTIETTTDSLRDFIIALDKSKADKLRYKVEDDVVRIFITPYRTSITNNDLEFSQGDFNVDVVIALGVTRREDLDRAITAHGRILHDATVISLTKQDSISELGSINWQEKQATSLCEMAANVTIELQPESMDGQMATAYLTGIIAETDRFRNEKTTPAALSLSSQLMTAGANQQLIAEKLEEPVVTDKPQPINMIENRQTQQTEAVPPQASNDGSLEIDHSSDADRIEKIHIDGDGNLQIPEDEELPVPVASELQIPEEEYDDSEPEVPTYQQDSAISEGHSNDLDQEKDEEPVKDEPKTTMTHGKKIMPTATSSLTSTVSDKPFDLQEAMKTAGIAGDTDTSLPSPAPVDDTDPEAPIATPPVPSPDPVTAPINPPQAPDDPIQPVTPTLQPPQVQAPVQSPAPPVQSPVVEPAPSLQPDVVVEEPQQPVEPITQVSSPSPDTLADLEKSVKSEHAISADAAKAKLEAAQDAVHVAAGSQPPQFPEANQSTGAQSVALEPPVNETIQPQKNEQNANTPPPVPPPMTPQFFDNDGSPGSSSNPFLNPAK